MGFIVKKYYLCNFVTITYCIRNDNNSNRKFQ